MSFNVLKRPPRLYRYAPTAVLERALKLGEFKLRAPMESLQLMATSHSGTSQPFLVLSFTTSEEESLYDRFKADCCLVVKRPEDFGERMHRAVRRALPQWAGIDNAVFYGIDSPLGIAFSRPEESAADAEWRFAWRPVHPTPATRPITIAIGSIEDIAELKPRTLV